MRYLLLKCFLVVTLGLCISVTVAAQDVEPKDSTRTISFTAQEGTYLAFDLCPDGEWIVFDLLGQLWRLPAEGGGAVPLTDAVEDIAEDLDPSISPDGEWIVFQSDRPEGRGLWLMPAEGGTPRLLSDTEIPARTYVTPAWSPEGTQLAFLRNNELHLHHLERDSTTHVQLEDPPEGRPKHPAWLPDGRILLRMAQSSGWMADPDGPLWLVDLETGQGEELPTGDLSVLAPAPSADGARLAYFAQDDEDQMQLWVQDLEGGAPQQLTKQEDVLPLRARWSPEGDEILYSAEGRLWAVPAGGGEARPIHFSARVRFDREEAMLPAVHFPEPGDEIPARGHMGLALSPDGQRIAKLALGKLWVWTVGEEPEAVTEVPLMAQWPSWSPDGSEIAWSAGRVGLEDLYVTHLESGTTRRLTDFEGRAERPAWSPDGEQIAFFYRPGLLASRTEASEEERRGRFAVIPVTQDVIFDPSDVIALPEHHNLRLPGYYVAAQERPVWSPHSDALIIPEEEFEAQILPLEGEARPLGIDGYPAFLNWADDSSIVYVQGNQLWRAEMQGETVQEPVLLSNEPAFYPSVARDGSVLYISPEGYRLRRPDGATEALGWPLAYRVQEAETPILIQRARVIDGTGAEALGTRDILIEDGRISRIRRAGSIRPQRGMHVIAADGRPVMPGLIDLHQHGWDEDDLVYAASLYHGVTTVREMGGPIARNAALGEAGLAGAYAGSRVILGGFQLYPGMGTGVTGAGYQRPQSKEEGDRALALAQAFGASYAKMRLPGSWAAGADLIRTAHQRGMRIGGHCAFQLPLIAAGISQVQHLSSCGPRSTARPRDDIIQLYREAGVATVPTMSIFSGAVAIRTDTTLLANPAMGAFVSPLFHIWGGYGSSDGVERMRRMGHEVTAAVGALHRAGIQIGAGTDAPYLPGVIHTELEDMVAAGLSPLEAIAAATGNAAKMLGAEEEIGTIQEGKVADLILLDADPLEDIRNTREIHTIIQGGRLVDREGILEWARASNP